MQNKNSKPIQTKEVSKDKKSTFVKVKVVSSSSSLMSCGSNPKYCNESK